MNNNRFTVRAPLDMLSIVKRHISSNTFVILLVKLFGGPQNQLAVYARTCTENANIKKENRLYYF